LNALLHRGQKQIGDRARITAGQHKDKVGVIVDKERRGWTIELEDCSHVTASFPMVALVEAAATIEDRGEATETAAAPDGGAGSEPAAELPEARQRARTTRSSRKASQPAPSGTGEASVPTAGDAPQDISKMTVKQLQALAKQRGIGIARTKDDFIRIIKKRNPEENLERLKGKILFDRVSELHISRLRTKEDLVRMLSV